MGRIVRSSLVGAIAVGASQLPQHSHALAAEQPSTIVVAQASTTTAKARAKAAKTRQRRSYSARRPAAPQSEPSSSSESFGGRKFWKEQEDN
jgi:microcystin-dependent protein